MYLREIAGGLKTRSVHLDSARCARTQQAKRFFLEKGHDDQVSFRASVDGHGKSYPTRTARYSCSGPQWSGYGEIIDQLA